MRWRIRDSCSQRSATCLAFRTKSPGEVWPISTSARSSTVPRDAPLAHAAMVVANLPSGSLAWGTLKRSSTSRIVAAVIADLVDALVDTPAPLLTEPVVERSSCFLVVDLPGGVGRPRRALGLEDEAREQPGQLGRLEAFEDASADGFGDEQVALVVDRTQQLALLVQRPALGVAELLEHVVARDHLLAERALAARWTVVGLELGVGALHDLEGRLERRSG